MVRRGALIRMIAIGLVAGVITTLVAVLIRWLPESASEEMDRIAFAYWFATVISIVIFSVVIGVIVYGVIAFRAQPDDETDGPPVHGNTKLEVVWTAIPAALVIAIGVLSAVVLSRNADAGENPLTVQVFAQQFAWKFAYPDDGGVRSDVLVLPVDRGVKLQMESADVIHSFWIPEMAQKQDVVPGIQTKIVITPTRTGNFTLICTELCGLGHATMRAPVRVLDRAAFAAWLEQEGKSESSGGPADGKALFASNGCGGCHVFGPAGSGGKIGPPLDDLAAVAEQAGTPVDEFVRQSIVDPNAVLAKGYQGTMPTTFADTMTPEEIDALVAYLTGEGEQQ